MRARFLKKCKCKDDGYVKLQEAETTDRIRYFELTVNCRECGKPFKEITPKGHFRGKVLFTDAKPKEKRRKKKKTKKNPKEIIYEDKDLVISVDPAVPEKDRVVARSKENFVKGMARKQGKIKETKDLSGVTFDKDRN